MPKETIELHRGPHDGLLVEIEIHDPPVTGYWRPFVNPGSLWPGFSYRYIRTGRRSSTGNTIFAFTGEYTDGN